MSDPMLRRTIRRCTGLLLVVLGAIAVELASLEYPDGGYLVGGGAIVTGGVYLLGSAFAAITERDEDANETSAASDPVTDDGAGKPGK